MLMSLENKGEKSEEKITTVLLNNICSEQP